MLTIVKSVTSSQTRILLTNRCKQSASAPDMDADAQESNTQVCLHSLTNTRYPPGLSDDGNDADVPSK